MLGWLCVNSHKCQASDYAHCFIVWFALHRSPNLVTTDAITWFKVHTFIRTKWRSNNPSMELKCLLNADRCWASASANVCRHHSMLRSFLLTCGTKNIHDKKLKKSSGCFLDENFCSRAPHFHGVSQLIVSSNKCLSSWSYGVAPIWSNGTCTCLFKNLNRSYTNPWQVMGARIWTHTLSIPKVLPIMYVSLRL